MLLFKGQRDSLLLPLQAVCSIVEKKHTLPILSNVLLEKNESNLMILATDIEMQIRTIIPEQIGDNISVTLAARKLQDILRSLPDTAEVSVSQEDKRVILRAEKSRFALQTLPANDFPKISMAQGEHSQLRLKQGQFKRLLSLVQYAMAIQDIRYYLNGLMLVVKNNDIRVVATDGHRLAFAAEQVEGDYEHIEVILPRKTVLELTRQLADNDESLEIIFGQTQVKFRFGIIELISKLIDGKFPDYERVIPQNLDKIILLPHDQLLHALQRAAILTNEKFRGVRLVLANNSLKIISSNAEQEEAQEELEIIYNGDVLDVGFNVLYLLDVLHNINSETIECRLSDMNSSALFTIPDNERFKYVVMPMRI